MRLTQLLLTNRGKRPFASVGKLKAVLRFSMSARRALKNIKTSTRTNISQRLDSISYIEKDQAIHCEFHQAKKHTH